MGPSTPFKISPKRSPSPFRANYDSYENTRENARGERLLNEYEDSAYLRGLKGMRERQPEVAPDTDAIIFRIRLSLRLVSFFVAASIIGVLGHFLNVYWKTQNDSVLVQERYGQRRVWPHWLKMKGTFILFSLAIVATLLDLLLLVSMFSRKARRVSSFSTLLTSTFCVTIISLWAAIYLYHQIDELRGNTPSDIMTHVCSKDLHPLVVDKMGSASVLCKELRYAWWAVMTGVVIEFTVLATVIWGMLANRTRGTYARVR